MSLNAHHSLVSFLCPLRGQTSPQSPVVYSILSGLLQEEPWLGLGERFVMRELIDWLVCLQKF